MSKTIYLVSCVKTKEKTGYHKAKDLYISPWFKKAKEYILKKINSEDSWYILSAEYGLLNPTDSITYYEKTLNTMSKQMREDWANNVFEELKPELKNCDKIVFLAGNRYREFLEQKIIELNKNIEIEIPMQGLKSGRQLQWLTLF